MKIIWSNEITNSRRFITFSNGKCIQRVQRWVFRCNLKWPHPSAWMYLQGSFILSKEMHFTSHSSYLENVYSNVQHSSLFPLYLNPSAWLTCQTMTRPIPYSMNFGVISLLKLSFQTRHFSLYHLVKCFEIVEIYVLRKLAAIQPSKKKAKNVWRKKEVSFDVEATMDFTSYFATEKKRIDESNPHLEKRGRDEAARIIHASPLSSFSFSPHFFFFFFDNLSLSLLKNPERNRKNMARHAHPFFSPSYNSHLSFFHFFQLLSLYACIQTQSSFTSVS